MKICIQFRYVFIVLLSTPLLTCGCDRKSIPPDQVAHTHVSKDHDKAHEDDHEHAPGAHGGTIVPLGADSYHAEALVDSGGILRFFMLGKDETRIQEIDAQTIKAFIKSTDSQEARNFELTPEPQEGDRQGKTSQFVGRVPDEMIGKPLRVTIPNLTIAQERFRIAFELDAGQLHSPMGKAIGASDEESLYLTPGGKYTQADIEANGKTIPSVKFKGIRSNHDDMPMPGDRICPISKTKANEQFAWVIDGKTYTFCCPPCIDEYVRFAKEQPDLLEAPESFIKE